MEAACNYNADATEDDGSCLFNDQCGVCGGDDSTCSGCTNPDACNYSPDATLDDGSCILDGLNFTMTVVLDQYPYEFSWTLSNGDAVLAESPDYSGQSGTVTTVFCLPEGCYDLTVNDTFGDGICCAWGEGSYTLEVDGVGHGIWRRIRLHRNPILLHWRSGRHPGMHRFRGLQLQCSGHIG